MQRHGVLVVMSVVSPIDGWWISNNKIVIFMLTYATNVYHEYLFTQSMDEGKIWYFQNIIDLLISVLSYFLFSSCGYQWVKRKWTCFYYIWVSKDNLFIFAMHIFALRKKSFNKTILSNTFWWAGMLLWLIWYNMNSITNKQKCTPYEKII